MPTQAIIITTMKTTTTTTLLIATCLATATAFVPAHHRAGALVAPGAKFFGARAGARWMAEAEGEGTVTEAAPSTVSKEVDNSVPLSSLEEKMKVRDDAAAAATPPPP